MNRLDAISIKHDYIVGGMSDREISVKYGVCRSAVSHFRRRHGIETRSTTQDMGHGYVKTKLEAFGYHFRDVREKSKTSRFNFLVDRVVKVQVLTSTLTTDETWKFTLTRKEEDQVAVGRFYRQLKNGRMRKDFAATCDVMILCCFYGDECRLYILPSKLVGATRTTITIPVDGGRLLKWKDRWSVIDDMVRLKKGEMHKEVNNIEQRSKPANPKVEVNQRTV